MPKAQTITVKARGLYDSGNNPWTLPDGALLEATNVEIGRDNVISPRYGRELLGTFVFSAMGRYQSALWAHTGTTMQLSSTTGSTWASMSGTYLPVSGTAIRAAESAKSLFFSGTAGTYVIESPSDFAPYPAGGPAAADVSATVAGVGTAVPATTRVAYRVAFGRKDTNGRVILGAPSSRVVLTNTLGTIQNVTVSATVPLYAADGNHFVQVYRTGASVDQNTDPGDECYLVYEQTVALSAASVTITDSTPDGLGGASLYTNPSQETILGANVNPPIAVDLVEFGGSMWYGGVTFPSRGILSLLGTTGTNGLALNDTVTVNAQVFTAKAAENIGLKEFRRWVDTDFTPASADSAIRATAESLCRVVNRNSIGSVYATDISEPYPSGVPGVISISEVLPNLAGGGVVVSVSRATAWSPYNGLSVYPFQTTIPNGLVYSKPGQPDAIPSALALAPILVGYATEYIVRLIPTRNALWVLKTDGIWRVTGTAGQFDVQPFDPTIRIVAPSSAVSLDNQVYFLSDTGFVRVSESGVEIISRPIEQDIRDFGLLLSTVENAYAVARESDHKYLVSLGGSGGTYEYDLLTQTWTQPGFSFDSAVVDIDSRRLVMCQGTALYRQARPGDGMVYADKVRGLLVVGTPVDIGGGNYSLTYTSVSGTGIPSVGDLVVRDPGTGVKYTGRYVGTLTSPNRVVLSDLDYLGIGWLGMVDIGAPYTMSLTYSVKSPTPGTMVEWQEAVLLFGTVAGTSATVTLTGDSGSDSALTIDKSANAGTTRQIRVWPGRVSSYSGTMQLAYSESVAYATTPTTLSGVVWTLSPQGDGVSR